MPFRYAELASPITDVFAKLRSPTRLGSDLRRFLLHAELTPSSARLDLSEKLLSSSLPFRFILFFIILLQKCRFVKGECAVFGKTAAVFEKSGDLLFEAHIFEEVDFSNNVPTVTPKTSAMA
jgi:hypothetical protein